MAAPKGTFIEKITQIKVQFLIRNNKLAGFRQHSLDLYWDTIVYARVIEGMNACW